MESNDKLEQLLRQMYAEETDTSELVDEEWKKFEAEHFSNRSDHPQPFLGRVHQGELGGVINMPPYYVTR